MSLPPLETLSKIFNRNPVKDRQQFSLNLCNVSKTPPFQIPVHQWGAKKSCNERGAMSVGGGGGLVGTQPPFCF
jgi:hypothetical protein